MFKKIREHFEKSQRVKGLSKAMSIVDEYMMPGLTPEVLDHNYGQAYADIRMVYINGDITENEMWAAITTLDNQYDKLRPRAVDAQLFA